MSNYRCNDCGKEFDEAGSYREYMGEFWGAPAYETFYICPYCKSDDFEEIKEMDGGLYED